MRSAKERSAVRVCVTFYVVAAHPGTSVAQRIAHRSDSAACTCRRVHVAGRCTHITFGMNNECRCVSDATRSHARNPKPTTHQHHRRPESRATWRVTAYRRCTHTAHVWRTHMTEHYIIRPKHTHTHFPRNHANFTLLCDSNNTGFVCVF